MQDVYVAGTGMTRFGKQPERSVRDLSEEAVAAAIADAGTDAAAIEYAFFSNAVGAMLGGQGCIPGQAALRHTGLLGIPIINVENACASGSTAFSLACSTLRAGAADVAIVVGAEKLSHPDKALSFAAFQAGYDQEEPPTAAVAEGAGAGRSVFMDVYAHMAREYMAASGATAEDFALVSVKAHRHGMLNPLAQYGGELTVARDPGEPDDQRPADADDVLADQRRGGRDRAGDRARPRAARRRRSGPRPGGDGPLRPRPRGRRRVRANARGADRVRRGRRRAAGRRCDRTARRRGAGGADRHRGARPLRAGRRA